MGGRWVGGRSLGMQRAHEDVKQLGCIWMSEEIGRKEILDKLEASHVLAVEPRAQSLERNLPVL